MRGRTSAPLRRQLEDDIEHGRLSPGAKLDEQALAARFDVSRTPACNLAFLRGGARGVAQRNRGRKFTRPRLLEASPHALSHLPSAIAAARLSASTPRRAE